MDLLGEDPLFDLFDEKTPIMSNDSSRPPHYIGPDGRVDDSLVANGCRIMGTVRHSIISTDACVGERAIVEGLRAAARRHREERRPREPRHPGRERRRGGGRQLGSVDTTKDTAVVGNDVVIGKGE